MGGNQEHEDCLNARGELISPFGGKLHRQRKTKNKVTVSKKSNGHPILFLLQVQLRSKEP